MIIPIIFGVGFFTNLFIFLKIRNKQTSSLFRLIESLNIDKFKFLMVYQKVLFVSAFILVVLTFMSVIR